MEQLHYFLLGMIHVLLNNGTKYYVFLFTTNPVLHIHAKSKSAIALLNSSLFNKKLFEILGYIVLVVPCLPHLLQVFPALERICE